MEVYIIVHVHVHVLCIIIMDPVNLCVLFQGCEIIIIICDHVMPKEQYLLTIVPNNKILITLLIL